MMTQMVTVFQNGEAAFVSAIASPILLFVRWHPHLPRLVWGSPVEGALLLQLVVNTFLKRDQVASFPKGFSHMRKHWKLQNEGGLNLQIKKINPLSPSPITQDQSFFSLSLFFRYSFTGTDCPSPLLKYLSFPNLCSCFCLLISLYRKVMSLKRTKNKNCFFHFF